MDYDSGDEWCLIDEQEWGTNHSDKVLQDHWEPECEIEPCQSVKKSPTFSTIIAQLPAHTTDLSSPDIFHENVEALLPDLEPQTWVPSRDEFIAMLAPAHRRKPRSRAQAHRSSELKPRTRSRLAFEAMKKPSFVSCMRAQMPSRSSLTARCDEDQVFTPVVPLTLTVDGCSQTEEVGAQTTASSFQNKSPLGEALGRSMELATLLKKKSQEYERATISSIVRRRDVSTQTPKQHAVELHRTRLRRSLEFQYSMSQLSDKQHRIFTAEIHDLQKENEKLRSQNSVLRGTVQPSLLSSLPVDDLDTLGRDLEKGLLLIREEMEARQNKQNSHHLTTPAPEKCAICSHKEPTVLLMPCRHRVLCSQCAVYASSCPIDRCGIADKVLTYGLNAFEL